MSCWFRSTSRIVNGTCCAAVIPYNTMRPPGRNTRPTCWEMGPPAESMTESSSVLPRTLSRTFGQSSGKDVLRGGLCHAGRW